MKKLTAILTLLSLLIADCGGTDEKAMKEGASDADSVVKAPSGYEVVSVTSGGTIVGRVRLKLGAKMPEGFQSPTNQDVCGAVETNNRLEPGTDGGVPWAIVYLEGVKQGRDYPASAGGATLLLDQKQCQYLPHLVAVPVGREVAIRNVDPVPHNVRIEHPTTDSILMNLVQPSAGRVDSFRMTAAGALLVKCDYHPWMNAYLFGVDNPYYSVSGADGSFSIDGIPPGSYTLKLWFNGPRIIPKRQPSGGIVGYGFSDPIVEERPVTLSAGGRQELQFEIAP